MRNRWTAAVATCVAAGGLALNAGGCESADGRVAGPATRAAAAAPVAIVELFTSEGCSSCPPADEAVAAVAAAARRDGTRVYALGFHVDYWNHGGWADRFSDAAYSDRQRRYADALGGGVYTPEAVVNGRVQFVGSRRRQLDDEVAAALKRPAAAGVAVTIEAGTDAAHPVVHFAVTDAPAGSVLNVAAVERGLSSTVTGGENGGHTLKHADVVRAFATDPLANPDGRLTLALPAAAVAANVSVVAYVQDPKTMAVAGAAAADLK